MNEKKTPTRIYVVEEFDGEIYTKRLVRAAGQAQAIRHIVRNRFTAHVPTQDELIELSPQGVDDATSTDANGDDDGNE